MMGTTRKSRTLLGIFRARSRGVNTSEIQAAERAHRARAKERIDHERAVWRLLFAILVTGSFYLLIGVKMAILSLSPPIETKSGYFGERIYSGRAEIVDRHGEILATNLPGYSLYAHPHELIDAKAAADGLASVFPEIQRDELYQKFMTPGRKFMWIKQKISPEQRQAVFNLGEPGLLFGPREIRLFPNGAIASHVLGGITFGELGVRAAEIEGQAGVELAFDSYLSDPANAHNPLKLSIDLSVQDALENVLAQGMKLNSAKGAAAVLMEADTGRVVALASLPDFDPNQRPKAIKLGADQSLSPRFNRASQGLYELGSTYKIFTAAMAMEEGYANPDTPIKIGHKIKSGKYEIADFHYYGDNLSLHDVIVKSSNIGTARIAAALGPKKQKHFLDKLGLLQSSHIQLPEAKNSKPLYPSDKNWSQLSAMTISYGHGIAASPTHLAAAYAAMVNGGYMVQPTLLEKLPEHLEFPRVISEQTSLNIRKMLRDVVVSDQGTARLARTAGYDIGGKTGTADKLRPEGGYYTNKNVNTFASAFPISDPKYVLIVTLDEPKNPLGNKNQQTAGWTVVPVASEIVQRVAPLLNLRPVYTSKQPID